MKELKEIILENNKPGGFNMAFLDIKDKNNAYKCFYERIKSLKTRRGNIGQTIDDNIISDFFDAIYTIWDKEFKGDQYRTPFRYSNDIQSGIKLDPAYNGYKIDNIKVSEYIDNLNDSIFKRKFIIFGNGTVFSNKALRGLNYETTVIESLKTFIHNKANNIEEDIPYKHNIESIYNEDNKIFDNIINKIKGEEYGDIEWDKYIIHTGDKNSKINSDGCVLDKNFVPGTNDTKLASKIADVVISDGKDEMYLSVKLDKYQTQSPSNSNVFSWVDKGNEPNEAFKNFCKIFGIPQDTLKNIYTNGTSEMEGNCIENDEIALAQLYKNITSGGYWKFKESEAKYVDFPDIKRIKCKSWQITDSKRSIYIWTDKGPCNFIFRTSSTNSKYPYRLFITGRKNN